MPPDGSISHGQPCAIEMKHPDQALTALETWENRRGGCFASTKDQLKEAASRLVQQLFLAAIDGLTLRFGENCCVVIYFQKVSKFPF